MACEVVTASLIAPVAVEVLAADGSSCAASLTDPSSVEVSTPDGCIAVTVGPYIAGGAGLPAGGTTDQVLAKTSNVDGEAGWISLSKALVGLSNVDNTSDANKPVSTAQAAAIAAGDAATAAAAAADVDAHEARTDNPHSVTKTQVGLGNVDNTSDLNKPISTATQTALNLKSDTSHTHTTTVITEGTNLYHTSARVNTLIETALGSIAGFTAFGKSLLTLASAAALRTLIGLATVSTTGRMARYTDASGTTAPTTGLFEDASGNVAVGSGSVTSGIRLDVNGNARITGVTAFGGAAVDANTIMRSVVVHDNPTSSKLSAQYTLYFTLSSANSNNLTAGDFLAQPSGAANHTGITRGVFAQVNGSMSAGFSASDLRASSGVVNVNSGNASISTGFYHRFFNFGTGTVTNAHGLLLDSFFNGGGGTVTNTFGIKIESLSSGTQTNLPYSIHSTDANARMYHAGNVGIGASTTTATCRLDVNGGIRSRPVTVGTLPAAATEASGTHRYVNDSNATMAAGLGNIVAAGGINFVRVYSDGTNWRIG